VIKEDRDRMYECKIIADSISPRGDRLTTFEVTYPRFVHSELMTHRMFSRNSSSSRAIPVEKMIQRVQDDPVLPVWWGKNQSGMQAKEELTGEDRIDAECTWLMARDAAVEYAQELVKAHTHKQIVNRLLEPWMWITVIITATDYANFFALRCHPDAQPEIQRIADIMRIAYGLSGPALVDHGEWHLPYVTDEEINCGSWASSALKDLSVARCARVSYLTHDGEHNPEKDLTLAERLRTSGHWSPFEHQAKPALGEIMVGRPSNLKGWTQYRKEFAEEYVPG